MSKLDKLMEGKPIHRHEDLKAIDQMWNSWADFLQFSSLAGLFLMIFILEALTKEQAKAVVWYLAGFLFVYATVAFIVARIALKHRMAYLNAERKRVRVSSLFDEAINKVKENK